MKCAECKIELIWSSDQQIEDDFNVSIIVTNYACPSCSYTYQVYRRLT